MTAQRELQNVTYAIQRVTFEQFMKQASFMFEPHRDELATHPELMDVNPDLEVYESLERAGSLLIVVAQDQANSNAVVGYSLGLFSPHPHHKDLIQLENDLLYLDPDHRGNGLGDSLIRATEAFATSLGARYVQWHAKQGTALHRKLDQDDNYRVQDIVFCKELR